jgi:hypothetical protein
MTTNTTPIQMIAEAMTGYTTAQLLDIVAELKNSTDENERIVKYGAYEVIEQRNPDIVPVLEAWCDDVNDVRGYADMLLAAVELLPVVK